MQDFRPRWLGDTTTKPRKIRIVASSQAFVCGCTTTTTIINLLGLLGVGLNFVLEIYEFVRLRPISVCTYFPVEVAPGIFGEKSFFQPPIQSIGSEGSHRAANPVYFTLLISVHFCDLGDWFPPSHF